MSQPERNPVPGRIIAGGGWTVRREPVRVKAVLFTALSVCWLGVLAIPLIRAPREQRIAALVRWLAFDPFGWGFIVFLLAFSATTIYFYRTERPRDISVRTPNRDHDLRKLYHR